MFCSFFRFMISSAADSGRPVGPVTHRHLLQCAGCRRFHKTCRTLGEDLRSEAAAVSPISRQLTGRILEGVSRRPQRSMPSIRIALAAAACLAVMAAVLVVDRYAKRPAPPAIAMYAIATPRVELAIEWTHVVQTPLITEAQNLSNNAQSGLRFLVACLSVRPPEGIAASQFGESTPPSVQ